MFPKKGNTFTGIRKLKIDYPAAIAVALRAELGDSHQAAKTIMKWTGASERTVKNWLTGRKGPSGEHLIQLIHYSDGVLDTILQLTERRQVMAAVLISAARKTMASFIDEIDRCLARSQTSSPREGSHGEKSGARTGHAHSL